MDNFVGMTLGNFEILKVIGRGGMSSVYLASDKDLERKVALKIPHERFMDKPSFVKRFRREAKAMARLRHPNIVQIYSVGNHGEIPFFAMEHIHGGNLENVIRKKGALSVGTAIKYASQIGRAIEYAHKKGVIHRDIKPANILVDPSGRLLVTDFGVSKLLSDEATHDTVGFVGTPLYMSPEQCGQGTLDHRTDIYSLGAIMFEMLTGQAAFSSDSPAEIIKKQLFDMPEFPAEFRDKIPDKLQTIISKMLAKDPEQRYPNVRAFLRDVERVDRESDAPTMALSSADTVALENPAAAVTRMAGRKKRKTRVLAIAAVCVLAVVAAASLVAFKRSDRAGLNIASLMETLRGNEKSAVLPSNEKSPRPEGTDPWAVREPEAEPASGEPVAAEPSAPEAEAVAAPEPARAEMIISSVPSGADVFIDSRSLGVTPLKLSEVKSGKRALAMKLEGYPTYREEISLEPASALKVFHDFEAAKEALIPRGSLTIDSEPSGAVVYINGEKRGATRLDLPDLRSADYTIVLEMEGYQSVRKKIALLPDENLRISLSLVEKLKYGSLKVRSRPVGADVLLNGEYKGATPLNLGKIPAGEYDITLRKKGYKPYHNDFVCREDSVGTIDASLEMTPTFAATESMVAGDRHVKRGELALAAAAYDRAISLDATSPTYRRKFTQVKQSLVKREVRGLLSSYKFAYDNEDAELLASVLDEGNADFLADQVANAKSLFREFDNIDMALSNLRLSFKGPGEASIEVHLCINADFAETGASAELLNAEQTLVLRRSPEAGWKICAIE